jgi:hypothetical protein
MLPCNVSAGFKLLNIRQYIAEGRLNCVYQLAFIAQASIPAQTPEDHAIVILGPT